MNRKLRMFKVGELKAPPGRPVDERRVGEIAESFARIGQLQPIDVVKTPKGLFIRYGLHRWLAARKIGWVEIEGVLGKPERHEINEEKIVSENLIRLHMAPGERSGALAELVRLREAKSNLATPVAKIPVANSSTPVAKIPTEAPPPAESAPRGRGRPISGKGRAIRDVAQEKGISEKTVRKIVERSEKRAAKAAESPPEIEAPRDERGQLIPPHLVERWGLHREAIELAGRLFRNLQTEIGKLAVDFDHDSWTQVQGELRKTWGSIRVRTPFAICAYCKGLDPNCVKCRGFGLQSEIEQQSVPRELLPA